MAWDWRISIVHVVSLTKKRGLRTINNFSLSIRKPLHQKCFSTKAKSFWLSSFVATFSPIYLRNMALLYSIIAVIFLHHSITCYFTVSPPFCIQFLLFSAVLAAMPLIIQLKRHSLSWVLWKFCCLVPDGCIQQRAKQIFCKNLKHWVLTEVSMMLRL